VRWGGVLRSGSGGIRSEGWWCDELKSSESGEESLDGIYIGARYPRVYLPFLGLTGRALQNDEYGIEFRRNTVLLG